ncbi:MAG: glycosyltransferase family 2 protein [bacterium]
MLLTFVIPAYNEESSIEELLKKVLAVGLPNNFSKEIIVLDDGSKDNTRAILESFSKKNPEVRFIKNEKNMGKSMTVKKGLLESKGDYVVIQDADLEYDPNDVSDLLKTCIDNKLDFALGNRFNKGNKMIYLSFFVGNKFLTVFSNIFTFLRLKKWIPDMEVCYKLIKGDIVRQITPKLISTSRYGFEPEIIAKLARLKINGKHLKFDVLPVKYFPRTIEQGKKIRWTDGVKALIEIIKYNLF